MKFEHLSWSRVRTGLKQCIGGIATWWLEVLFVAYVTWLAWTVVFYHPNPKPKISDGMTAAEKVHYLSILHGLEDYVQNMPTNNP